MKPIRRRWRSAFTLIELLLSLGLIVVVTSLVGSLMTLYARSFTTKGDQIRQKQLALSLLTMIADDVRAVVLTQEYDESVLQGMMGAGGASAAGTEGTETGTGTETSTELTTPSTEASTSEEGLLEITSLPPGIYGSRYQLMIDVSRIPRSEEYVGNMALPGQIADVPGDVKSVTYMMQAANPLGVQDSMTQVATTQDSVASNSGLIRRSIDRLVLKYAEQNAMATQLMSAGELIAPEVVALEFAYYDGTQWLYDWDSSLQGLPWLVQIVLAMQSPAAAELHPLAGGVALSTLTVEDQQAYGIQVFEVVVAIPGAQLQAAPATETESGLGAVGL